MDPLLVDGRGREDGVERIHCGGLIDLGEVPPLHRN